jgi:plasmid stabilization system protein ParE
VTAVIWSPQALLDLQSIRDYIAHDSPRYADLMVQRLVAAVERLEAFPQSGRVVPERNDEYGTSWGILQIVAFGPLQWIWLAPAAVVATLVRRKRFAAGFWLEGRLYL